MTFNDACLWLGMDPEKTRRAIFGDLASENVPLGNTSWPLYRGTPFS